MNPLFFILLPFVMEAVKMIEGKISGKGKGKLKKKKVVNMIMDSVETAVVSKQINLGGVPFPLVKRLAGSAIDLAVTMFNGTGIFKK